MSAIAVYKKKHEKIPYHTITKMIGGTNHIIRCQDPTRTQLYYLDGVDAIFHLLKEKGTPPDLSILIKMFLQGHGNTTFSSLITPTSPYYAIARCFDIIGIDNILIGRLPHTLVSYMTPIIPRSGGRGYTSDIWVRNLSTRLILLTHRQ